MDYAEKIKRAKQAGYTDSQIKTFMQSKGLATEGLFDGSFSERASSVIKKAGESVYENIAGEGAFAGQSPLRRGAQATAAAFQAPTSIAFEALPKPARSAITAVTDTVGQGFKALTDAIGSTPALQKWVEDNPDAARNLGEIAGTLSAGGQIAGNILTADVAAKGAQALVNATGNTIKKTGQAIGEAVRGTRNLVARSKEIIRPTPTPEKALGEVLQSKKPLTTKELNAFKEIDTSKIKTYTDLEKRINESIGKLSDDVDDYLAKDPTQYSLEQLTTKTTSGSGRVVERNYVDTALSHLREMYEKTVDDVALADIDDVIAKAKSSGLTRQEVNDISRLYNQEFGSKAFNKVGDPLTSVNAQAYENVRGGLKDVARQGLGGSEAAATDKTISSLYNIKDLVSKNRQAVQKLEQKISERGLLEKVGSGVAKYGDILSGGSIRAFIGGLLPRGAGYKVMNALDLEEKLRSNLNVIEKAIQNGSDDAIKSAAVQLEALSKAIPQPIAQTIKSQGNAIKSATVPTVSNITPRDFTASGGDSTTEPFSKEDFAALPKFDPTGAMGLGGMAARAGAKAAAPILKEAAEVAEQMSVRTYRLVKEYLRGGSANAEITALNEVAKLEPKLLSAPLDDIKAYFSKLAKYYEDSIGN